jgi:hypothetical protein
MKKSAEKLFQGMAPQREMRFLLHLFVIAEDAGQQELRPWHCWEGMMRFY